MKSLKKTDQDNIMVFPVSYKKHLMNIVEHDTLLVKLEHYGIGVLANIWLESYLSHRKHHVSINGYDSNITTVTFGVPQGSVIDPL